jgi:hypothetical protein
MKVELSFAERCCLSDVLQRQKGDIETARHIREIRQRFDLRDATRVLDKVNLELRRIGRVATWDEINENLVPLLEWVITEEARFDQDEKAKNRDEILDALRQVKKWIEKARLERRSFTIDSAYVRWIKEKGFEGIDWSKVRIKTPTGVQEKTLDVDLGRMEAFASLDEALTAARPVREEAVATT